MVVYHPSVAVSAVAVTRMTIRKQRNKGVIFCWLISVLGVSLIKQRELLIVD
jgi:hypothetical protein